MVWKKKKKAKWIYFCDNETVDGVEIPRDMHGQLSRCPRTGKERFLIADMSSNFMSREFDISKFACVFAGAQKNLGVAGLTLTIVRRDLLLTSSNNNNNNNNVLPIVLSYSAMLAESSLLNTPNCFAIWVTMQVLRWIRNEFGDLRSLEAANAEKAERLYQFLGSHPQVFRLVVKTPKNRSRMNVCFTVLEKAVETEIFARSAQMGITGIAGHRSVGGMRVSLYNAVPLDAVDLLIKCLSEFT